jgi:hypothetical protein
MLFKKKIPVYDYSDKKSTNKGAELMIVTVGGTVHVVLTGI